MTDKLDSDTLSPDSAQGHLSFSGTRQPLLTGDSHQYLLARGDQLAFAAEVVRFGFAPDDFALDIERLPGKRSARSTAPTFLVRVANIHNRRSVKYLGGPGRAWVARFLEDLIVGKYGEP
ncbi:MAG: hypothetical protein E6H66_03670 [Betaproteobacteria bacterium]|nr:MAG: hypothetical protein E6H66_03670 [Betaproteobacteria bacterium]